MLSSTPCTTEAAPTSRWKMRHTRLGFPLLPCESQTKPLCTKVDLTVILSKPVIPAVCKHSVEFLLLKHAPGPLGPPSASDCIPRDVPTRRSTHVGHEAALRKLTTESGRKRASAWDSLLRSFGERREEEQSFCVNEVTVILDFSVTFT